MLSLLTRRCAIEIKTTVLSIQRRNFILGKRISERKFKLRDKMPEDWTLIYRAPMEYYLKSINHVTTLSAVLFAGFVVTKFINRDKPVSKEMKPYEMLFGNALMSEYDYYYFAVALVAVNVTLRVFLHRYILRIYRNGSDYTAVFEGQLPFTKEKIEFARGAVKEIKAHSIMPWKDSFYQINNNRKCIMLMEKFRTPSELFDMLKKPMKPRVYIEDKYYKRPL